jgi:hypothetical protein
MLAHQQQQQQQQHAQQQQQAAAAAAASASDGSGADDDDDDDDDGDKKGGKRKRQMKSPEQLAILEKEFSISPLPNKETRTRISNLIGLTARQVQIWFQNKRISTPLCACVRVAATDRIARCITHRGQGQERAAQAEPKL